MPTYRTDADRTQIAGKLIDRDAIENDAESESICPVCRSHEILSSSARGIVERTILRVLKISPYWCGTCDSRFYLFSKGIISRQAQDLGK